jgi:hypothetical protein
LGEVARNLGLTELQSFCEFTDAEFSLAMDEKNGLETGVVSEAFVEL